MVGTEIVFMQALGSGASLKLTLSWDYFCDG